MKALILSDVHSNIYSLEAIWNEEKDSDITFCAGDIVDYGPFPQEVINWMRKHQVTCVKGNHDISVASTYRECDGLWELKGEDYRWRHHNAKKLDANDIEFIEKLPEYVCFELDNIPYVMQHKYGEQYETVQSLYQFDDFWNTKYQGPVDENQTRRLIFGHTHRRCVNYLSDQDLWLNSGSTSYRRPDDPDKDAHYAIIVDGQIFLKSISYDRTPLLKEVEKVDMNEKELRVAYKFFG